MKQSDITIEGTTATWRMPTTNGELGGTYTGTFQFRCYLDPIRQIQAGRELRELLGSLGDRATATEFNLALALTQLKHRVLVSPPFWSSTAQESGIAGNVGDQNIIIMVLDAAMRSEDLFKEQIAKEREEILDRTIVTGEKMLRTSGEE